MTALVFGGAGFVGSAIVDRLLARGEKVRVFDLKPHPDPRVESITGDLRDRAAVAAACDRVETVYQTAALIDWSPGKRDLLFDVNVTGNRHVIDGCRLHGVGKLVFTSSIDVVFDGSPIALGNETLPYPARHLDDYGASKAQSEQDTLRANGDGLLTCALRSGGVYGPGDATRLPAMLRAARQGMLIRMGDGRSRFNHVYVENLAEAHLQAADRLTDGSPVAGQAYFIVDEPATNFYDFFIPFWEAMGITPPTRNLPCGLMHAAASVLEALHRLRPAADPPLLTRYTVLSTCRDFSFSPAKARADLDYRQIVPPEEAIRRTVAWLRDHPLEG